MELIGRMLDGSIPYDLGEALRNARVFGFRLPNDERMRHLQKIPVLRECSRRQLRAVARISTIVEAPADAVLTRRGEPGDEFFMILDGAARVTVSRRRHLRLGPGDFFGEMSLLDGEPRSATVHAETAIRLLVINRLKFRTLLREVPELGTTIMTTLSRRVRAAERAPTA